MELETNLKKEDKVKM